MEIDRIGTPEFERRTAPLPPRAPEQAPGAPEARDSVHLSPRPPSRGNSRPKAAPSPSAAESREREPVATGPIAQLEGESIEIAQSTAPLFFHDASKEARELARSLILASGLSPSVEATLVRDLSSFPMPVLRLLKADELDVVVVKEGQSLADTPLLPSVKPGEYQALAEKGKAVFDAVAAEEAAVTQKEMDEARAAGNDDPFHLGMVQYWEASRLEKSLAERLVKENLGFSVHTAREPVNLRELASRYGAEGDESFAEWEKTLRLVNDGRVTFQDGLAQAGQGVILIPYTYYRGRPVSHTTLKSLQHYDSQEIKNALGIHLWEDRLVLLHEEYAADPGKEVGHYRIVLHETGHALDHAIERLPDRGARHRKIVDDLYARDRDELKRGGANRFISPRAMDSVREYFAEAVESYMTVKVGDDHEYYKGGDNHVDLQRLNPDLFAYIDEVMRTDFGDGKPAAPVKSPD